MRLFGSWAIVILRIIVGGVFAYSGWNKLVRPIEEFQYAMEAYQTFPTPVMVAVAHTMPWVELIFGVFMMAGFFRQKAASVLSVLTFAFITLLVSTKLRGIEIANCGCFGEGIHLSVAQALLVDLVLFLALSFFARFKIKMFEIDQLMERLDHV